ncbi:MAG: alpha/beta fold hydrolase [Candidatus Hodarchaeota archaeon]
MIKAQPDDLKSGYLNNRVPYVKIGTGEKNIIYFVGGGGFIKDIALNPHEIYDSKKHLVPEEFNMHVLGYPKELLEDFTIESLVNELEGAIRKNIGKGIIIGSSFGGKVALCYSASYPELVEKLILTSSARVSSDSFKKRVLKWIDFIEKGKILKVMIGTNVLLNKRLLRVGAKLLTILNWQRMKAKIDLSNFSKALKIAPSEEILKQNMQKISAETFILGGTRDIVHSVENFKETASLIPNATLVLLEGCGHEMPTENKVAYAKELRKILEK